MAPPTQPRTPSRPSQGRAAWFVCILLSLLLAGAAGTSWTLINDTRFSIVTNLERTLSTPIRDRAAEIGRWYGSLQDRITNLARMDMVRLFATEVNALGEQAANLLQADDAGQQDADASPGPNISLMRNFFTNFMEHSDILSVTLFNRTLQPYLAEGKKEIADATLSLDLLPAAREAIGAGRVVVLPADSDGILTRVGIFQPIFAPDYIETPDASPVGLALLYCDITALVEKLTIPRDVAVPNQQGWLLQKTDTGLQSVRSEGVAALPRDWATDSSGNLPVALRALPDGTRAYVLAMSVDPLPWLVAQDQTERSVLEAFEAEKSRILFRSAACTLIAMLFVGMVWWWLIGRRERMVSSEMKDLYETVNQQHGLLTGINGALADGIILTDMQGAVRYVNDAFASIAGLNPEQMIGRKFSAVFSKDIVIGISLHVKEVLLNNKAVLSTETLEKAGRTYHYQISCSPYHKTTGELSGMVSVYRDVTNLVLAQKHAQTMLNQTVSVLVRAIEAIDPYLRGQSMQTGILAAHLAKLLQMDETHVNTLSSAANLSQIGMIQLPRALVNKTSALSDTERQQLRRHVEYARASLTGIDFGLPVVDAIYAMHEHLDGSGYPLGLQGDDINIDSRVLSVANTFCALVRPRSYRQAHGVRQAITILAAKPPKYDPVIVQTLYSFLQSPDGKAFLESLTRAE